MSTRGFITVEPKGIKVTHKRLHEANMESARTNIIVHNEFDDESIDNHAPKTGDLNAIPDDVIMKWCSYLTLRDRTSFARSCKRIAEIERVAEGRIVNELTLYLWTCGNTFIAVNNKGSNRSLTPGQILNFIKRAHIRTFTVDIRRPYGADCAPFIRAFELISYQSLTVEFGIQKDYIKFLNALILNRNLRNVDLSLIWWSHFKESHIEFVNKWLLKLHKTRSLKLTSDIFPTPVAYQYLDRFFNDVALSKLVKQTKILDVTGIYGRITVPGVISIFEAFCTTDLREVRLATSKDDAAQIKHHYKKNPHRACTLRFDDWDSPNIKIILTANSR
ncbi:hypothetical protein PFISCL1PPCAC_12054 [Pristionchus fissidentatus]|uniref:F-box domain-containing protein n=1 Tax=Pristionchus fissidentatus TaxID=1538716 RepID=A0AAV5VRW3_9BILA|nr:hypothetical protein PFISCL1PPCAC_12054 [Pristionchus fissidentatus]